MPFNSAGNGDMDGCSGGRRGLEVRLSVSVPQDPLPRCAVDTEVTPSSPAAEGAAQPFPETHAASTVVLSHLLGKAAQPWCLGQLRRGWGHQASEDGGLNMLSWSCQTQSFKPY